MGILGKLLIFVNLLAGAGFVYLAIQDWALRQTAAASVLSARMVLQGFPLEGEDLATAEEDPEIPFPVPLSGDQINDTVSKKFLETYFNQVKGTSQLGGAELATSQVGEVRRVRQKVQQLLDAADGDKARATVAAAFLIDQAETLDDRQAIEKLKSAGNAQELTALLLGKFDEVIDKEKSRVKDETERRLKLAHLLTYLDVDAVWQKRVALIVGLRRYAITLTAQTVRLDRMFTQVQRQIEQDQISYSSSIENLWRKATDRTLEYMDSERRKTSFQNQVTYHQEFVNRIQTEVKQLKDKFTSVKAQVDDLLVKQTASEQKLFEVQRTVGSILGELFQLEDKLARLERERR